MSKKGLGTLMIVKALYHACQFRDVVTEFGCQGLELDFPIVLLGNDFDLERQ
jgi:hypothetical protein